MRLLRAQGFLAAASVTAVFSGCDDPVQGTDLRPEGPPEVLAVLVMSDQLLNLHETAVFCKQGDEKRPGLVGLPDFTADQICPEDLSQGVDPATAPGALYPTPLNDDPNFLGADPNGLPGWHVRIMFDELLDPTVEDLREIVDGNCEPLDVPLFKGSLKDTQPVTLECENTTGNFEQLEYNGYYVPNGNRVTWPLGPSLFINPGHYDADGRFTPDSLNTPSGDVIPPGAECRVTIRDTVVDKSGNAVPTEQRQYSFFVEKLKMYSATPDGEESNANVAWFTLQFSAPVDYASLDATDFLMTEDGVALAQDDTTTFILPYLYTDLYGPVSVPDFDPDGDGPLCDSGCGQYIEVYALTADGNTFAAGKTYTIEVAQDATILDFNGGPIALAADDPDNQAAELETAPFELVRFAGCQSSSCAPVPANAGLTSTGFLLEFTYYMDGSTLDPATEFTIDPPLESQVVSQPGTMGSILLFGAGILVRGWWRVDTEYTMTLNAGATIDTSEGTPVTYTNPAAETRTLRTQAFAMTNSLLSGFPNCPGPLFGCMEGDPVLNAATPYPSGSTIPSGQPRGCDPATDCFIPFYRITLNGPMAGATFTEADFTIEPALANLTIAPVGAACVAGTGPCTTFDIFGDWVENTTYTLTMPATLAVDTIHTQMPQTFTLGTARTHVFTVGPQPAEPVLCPAND
jgi:hypothetical protein